MEQAEFNRGLLAFIGTSPTPFHAVANAAALLREAGFREIDNGCSEALNSGQRYFTTHNGSSIIAWVMGKAAPAQSGIRMVGAHTDSPCLMIKPQPELTTAGYFQLGIEVYGGALLNPWFDRDLSIAGRVVYRDTGSGQLHQTLIDFKKPVAAIPSLAIHLDRDANTARTVNPQINLPPLLFPLAEGRYKTFRDLLVGEQFSGVGSKSVEVVDYELSLYDTQPPALVGLHDDFIASARLDNLLSCYTGIQALLNADDSVTSLLVCSDHEEVGSGSASGARGPLLQSVLHSMIPEQAQRVAAIARSLMISADNAHGVHPNYIDKHDLNHGPILNRGPVIKVNSSQRYATNSITSALFRRWCAEENVPVQSFVTRADMGCGSTIGPITATEIGVPTLDVGVPTFAMHSIRELAGSEDGFGLFKVLRAFYRHRDALTITVSK